MGRCWDCEWKVVLVDVMLLTEVNSGGPRMVCKNMH